MLRSPLPLLWLLLALSLAAGCKGWVHHRSEQAEVICDGTHQRRCIHRMIRVLESYLESGDPVVFAGFNRFVRQGQTLPPASEELRFQQQMLMVLGLLLQGRKPAYPSREHEIVASFVLPSRSQTVRLQELLLTLSHKKTGPDGKPVGGDYTTAYQQIMGGFFTLQPDLLTHLDKSGMVKIGGGMVIADVGCGVGSQAVAMARRLGPSGRVHAVDISRRVVDFLGHLKKHVEGGQRIHPVLSRRDNVTLEAGTVDLAMIHGINFLFGGGNAMPKHARGLFRSIRRALKPDGRLLIRSYQQTSELVRSLEQHGFTSIKRHNAQPRRPNNNSSMIIEDYFVLFKVSET